METSMVADENEANPCAPLKMESILIKEEVPEYSEMEFKDEPLDFDDNIEAELSKDDSAEDMYNSCDKFLKTELVEYDSEENEVDFSNVSSSDYERDGDDQVEQESTFVHGDKAVYIDGPNLSRKRVTSGHLQTELEENNTAGGPYRCPLCLKEYKREAGLASHLKSHHLTLEPYLCSMCSKSFRSSKMLAKHKRTHKQVYKCDVCSYEANSRRGMSWHQKSHKVYWCTLCGVDVRTVQDCTEHQQAQNDPGKESYQCGVCNRKCNSMDGFFDHRKMHAEAKCEECGKTTTLRSLSVLHKLSHSGANLFECAVCSKQFSQKIALRLHENSHVDKVTHCCKVCNQDFVWFSDLARHRKVHETSDTLALVESVKEACKDLHKCSTCGESFHNFIEYCKHLQSHWQGKDVYLKCTICNSSFTNIANLLNHRKNHR